MTKLAERYSGKRTKDVDLLGILLCVVGGIGFYLSVKEAFAYRVLTAIGQEKPFPFLYYFYNQLFLPLFTLLLLISGGGILQRRIWSRKLLFALAVSGFSFFVLLNTDELVRLTANRDRPPIVVPVGLYFFVYLAWGFLIWFLLRESVRFQFVLLEMPEEKKGKGSDVGVSYEPLPEELRE